MDTKSRHLLKVGVMANVFEWYEFFIFVFLSGTIGQLFFSAAHPVVELINTYFVFALSFIARPIGGLFFGLVGDRWGRSFSLRLSLILMSVPTVLIGLLPTYPQISTLAAISLVLLRLIQGFAAGGELPMTACYVFEAASTSNRSFLCSVIATSPKIGMLLASFVSMLLIHFFDEAALLRGAWRIPFLLGIPLTVFIVYLRQTISDALLVTPPLSRLHTSDWTTYMIPIVKAISLVSFGALYFYIVLVWMPSYLIHFLHISPQIASFNNTATLCVILPLYFLINGLLKYINYPTLLFISLLLMVIVPFFGFSALEHASWQQLLLVQILLALVYVGYDGILIETLGHLFPPDSRSLSFGIAWAFAAAFIGGTTPLVCTYVIHKTGFLLFPAFYIALFGVFALPTVLSVLKQRSKEKNKLENPLI